MTVALETIVSPPVLRRVWKEVRKRDRELHLTRIQLVRDSTGGVAFELSLNDVLENVNRRVLETTYRPHAAIIVEAAKSKLLHRRLSFLMFEDALILGALVQAARPSLMKQTPEWVSFGQKDKPSKKQDEDIDFDYEDWWTKWLRYRRLRKVIEEDDHPLLVVSDITNFFSSIDLTLLRSQVSGETSLERKAIDLMFYLLERPAPYRGLQSHRSPRTSDCRRRYIAYLGAFLLG